MWAKSLRLKKKKIILEGGELIFPAGEKTLEREGESSNFSLRSTEIGWSEFVGPRMKAHLLDEGYAWVLKTRDFAEDLSKKFGKSKVLGLGSVHGTSWSFFYTSRGRDSF